MDVMEKIKDNLFYDERSAGGIVYRMENGKIVWLVIRTANIRSRKRMGTGSKKALKAIYKFPKGHLKDKEFLKAAALREVEEEGQVKAKILTKIGSRNYVIWDRINKKKIIKKVTFFLMEYLGESKLKHFDMEVVLERLWLPYEEACEKLVYDSEKVLLGKARKRLEFYLRSKKS
jgi:ADP-ribose pyrophosphatase YjhB (NUDIX family)